MTVEAVQYPTASNIGALAAANNLSDLNDAATARSNLSVYAIADFSAAPVAAEPLKADGSGGVVGKTANLNGITVSDFTTIFPSKPATYHGILTSTSVATGGLSLNGFTNTTASAIPVLFSAYSGSTSPTAAAILLRSAKWNGATSAVALAATETVFQLRNWTSNVMTVLGSGAVGIREDAPSAQLHINVNGASTTGAIIKTASSATANAIETQTSATAVTFAIGPAGQLKTNQAAANTNTPSGGTAYQIPWYAANGTLLGYVPVYAAAW